jgi:hypothetical protein
MEVKMKYYVKCVDHFIFEDVVGQYDTKEEAMEAVSEMNAAGMNVWYEEVA